LHSIKKVKSLATSFAQFSLLLAALLHLFGQKLIIQTFTIVIFMALNIYT
jgi:ABC-type multidrug transport system permease subunit